MYENQHTPSGTEVDTDESVDGCKTACLRDVTCVAVDYRRSDGRCMKHTAINVVNHLGYHHLYGSDQYVQEDYIGEQIPHTPPSPLKRYYLFELNYLV